MPNNREAPPLRFGLIGCGQISKQHLLSISLIPEAELAAVCDVIPGRAEHAATQYNVPWFADYRELLNRNDIDVVSIATPHGLHGPMGTDSASAGKHVIMEKPLGLSTSEAEAMLEVFRQRNLNLFPVLQVRYNPILQTIKNTIGEKRLGKVHNASLVVRWARPQKYFDNDPWRGTRAMEGALLFSQGAHYLDVMRWLVGSLKSVYAKKATIAHRIETDDFVMALLRFENGAFGSIEFTLCTYPRNLECSLSILGSKGTVKVSGTALNQIEVWEVEGVPKPSVAQGFAPNVYEGGLYQGSPPNHIYVYLDAIRELKGIPNTHVTSAEAIRSLRVAEAIYTSAERNDEVFLSL